MQISYTHLESGYSRDSAALADIAEYLGERLTCFVDAAHQAEHDGTAEAVQKLNIMFAFIGIAGLPFHAFCRAHCPTAYTAWMAD